MRNFIFTQQLRKPNLHLLCKLSATIDNGTLFTLIKIQQSEFYCLWNAQVEYIQSMVDM